MHRCCCQLHGVLDQYPDSRLLILDPLSAFLGVRDSHRDSDVRQALGPLTDLAAKHEISILGITHLNKATGHSALSRFMGSTGIIAASRAAFLATWHEDELLMLPVKSNVAPDIGGLSYQIKGATIAGDIETSFIKWTGETELDPNDVLSQQQARHSAPKKHDAIDFLKTILKNGPVSLEEINQAACADDIAWSTVRRAYDALNIESIREKKYQGRFRWHTPEQAAAYREQDSNT